MKDKIESRLNKINILISKSEKNIGPKLKKIIDAGIKVCYFPTINIIPTNNFELFDSVIKKKEIDLIIFTSGNAVKYFLKRIEQLKLNFNSSNKMIISVGNATAQICKQNNIKVDFIPSVNSAKGIISEITPNLIRNKTVLIPCSELTTKELEIALTKMEAKVYSTPVYTAVPPSPDEYKGSLNFIKNHNIHFSIFTSPSSFNNFIEIITINCIQNYFHKTYICAIGNTTANSIKSHGYKVNFVPKKAELEEISEYIYNYCSSNVEEMLKC